MTPFLTSPFLISLWTQVYDLWRYGGVVMPSLFVTAAVLWYALGLRILRLRRGDRRSLRGLLDHFTAAPTARTRGLVDEAARRGALLRLEHGLPVSRRLLDLHLGELEDELRAGTGLVTCLVSMAPLLGLLGTVTGLIETFGSLGQSSTSSASEGIAGGIVEALYATQMGLAIAVPGLLAGGMLYHKQQTLELEFDALKALLGGALQPGAAAEGARAVRA
jgi:biopolymer transport protein ExbB